MKTPVIFSSLVGIGREVSEAHGGGQTLEKDSSVRCQVEKSHLLNVITVSPLGEVNFHALVTYSMET